MFLPIPDIVFGDWLSVQTAINQIRFHLSTDATPPFAGVKLTGLTASTLVGVNASKVTESITIGTGLDYTMPTLSLSHLGIESLTDPGADRILFWDESGGNGGTANWLGVGNSIAITNTTLDTIQDIRTSASPTFVGLTLSGIAAEATDVDKFLVDSSGVIKYRTGAQVLSDIGAQTQGDVLDDLNTLGAPASDGQFIVATGAGVFAYESTTTARTSLGVGTGDSPAFAAVSLGTGELTCGSINRAADTLTLEIGGTAEISITSTATTFGGNLIITNGGTIGQVDGPVITFDDTNNDFGITGGKIGLGTTSPNFDTTLRCTDSTTGGMNVTTAGYTNLPYPGMASQAIIFNARGFGFTVDSAVLAAHSGLGLGIAANRAGTIVGLSNAGGYAIVVEAGACSLGSDVLISGFSSSTVSSDSDAADVSACNVLLVNTSGGNITLGGLAGGVDGQLVYVFKYDEANILTIEHQEATGTQKFMLKSADLVYNGVGICLPFICKNNTWYIAAYPRDFSA